MLNGQIMRLDPLIGPKRGTIVVSNGKRRVLSYKGFHLFKVYEDDKIFLESRLANKSIVNRLFKWEVDYVDFRGRSVLLRKKGNYYFGGELWKPTLEKVGVSVCFESSDWSIYLHRFENRYQFRTEPVLLESVIALALAHMYALDLQH